jgi:hypothetical protein
LSESSELNGINILLVIPLIVGGLWLMSLAIFNWDFAMKKENVKWPLGHLPRLVARIIYGIWGLFFLMGGILSLTGVIHFGVLE